MPGEPRLPARVRRVHVPVEHQARPAAGARPRAEHVRAPVLDLLPLHLQAEPGERLAHELRHRLLVAGEARDRDGAQRPLDERRPRRSAARVMLAPART